MATEQPVCKSARGWVRERLKDRNALAPLTGQDGSALSAFAHLVELYARADDMGRMNALAAMRATVRAMQPSVQHLAKAAIPHVMDWSDEDRIWRMIVGL